MADDRTLAQFFFELGYGSCWAEAAIRNGEKPPFDLTDAVIERAWAITPETYDDHAEFDEKLALVDSAPDMLAALTKLRKGLDLVDPSRPLQYADAMDLMRKCADEAIAKVAKP